MKLYLLICIILAVANARPFMESEMSDAFAFEGSEESDMLREGLILNHGSVDTTGIALPPIGTPGVIGSGALQVIINVMAADPNNVVVTTVR